MKSLTCHALRPAAIRSAKRSIRLAEIAEDAVHLVTLKAKAKDIQIHSTIRKQPAADLGGRALCAPDPAQSLVQRHEVHAHWRRNQCADRLDQRRRAIHFGQGQWPWHCRRRNSDGACPLSGKARLPSRMPNRAPALACPSCRHWCNLHGGKFDLRSKLREGTEALAFFPRDRVLKARAKMEEAGPPAGRAGQEVWLVLTLCQLHPLRRMLPCPSGKAPLP